MWILIRWLRQKPADLDLQCFQKTINPGSVEQGLISLPLHYNSKEGSDSVVECLTRDRVAAGSSLTGVTVLWSLSKIHFS